MFRVKELNLLIKSDYIEEEIRKQTGVVNGAISIDDLRNVKHVSFQYWNSNDDNVIELLSHCTQIMSADIDLIARISSDISFLRNFSNIKALTLRVYGDIDFSTVGELSTLRELSILCDGYAEYRFINIEALGKLTNLRSLTIADSGPTDLSFLKEMKGLKKLELVEPGPLTNVAEIGKLQKLKEFEMYECVLWDAAFLKQLGKCKIRFLSNIIINNTGLEELRRFEKEDEDSISDNLTQNALNINIIGVDEIGEETLRWYTWERVKYWFPEYVPL